MAASLDFGSFSTAEKSALLTAAKAELLRRAGLGAVSSGSSSNQNFAMAKMSMDELTRMLNALQLDLGYSEAENRVMPNFAYSPGNGFTYGTQ